MARKISVEIVGDARSLEKAFNEDRRRSAKRFQGDMDKTGSSRPTGVRRPRPRRRVRRRRDRHSRTHRRRQSRVRRDGRSAEGHGPDQRGPEVDREGRERVGETGRRRWPRSLMNMSGVDDEVDQVRREPAADVHEHPQRDRQRQRHLQPGDQGDARHDGCARAGHDPVGDPARQSAERPGQRRDRAAPRRCQFTARADQADQDAGRVRARRCEAQKLILRELNNEFGGSAQGGRPNAAGQAEHPPQHPPEPGRLDRRDA